MKGLSTYRGLIALLLALVPGVPVAGPQEAAAVSTQSQAAQNVATTSATVLAETELSDSINGHWQQFKKQHLDPVTRQWSDELEDAQRAALDVLEKAQYGSDKIVNILQKSKSFPPGLKNPKQTIEGANVQITIKQAYLQQMISELMSSPIALDSDVTNSYFKLRKVRIAFNEKRNVIMAFFNDGYAGFRGLVKAGIKVNSATMQFAPTVVTQGNRTWLRLKARMTYIDIANHSSVVDKLFASIAEELVLGKGYLLERDLTPLLAVSQEISLFGQERKVNIMPQQISVNVNKDRMFIAARL
ncbi:MAG: hypothetical protein OEZ68_05240 [Gammaproteobacteria bacterium]|nr:hypothetical protein [Gammaproteobacteria bacterium]MDH5800194.1 hypothetical protein [Gammaproteobacteria bacterium]